MGASYSISNSEPQGSLNNNQYLDTLDINGNFIIQKNPQSAKTQDRWVKAKMKDKTVEQPK